MFLGSSVVEQVAVNHLVAGSNPARGAIIMLFVLSTDGLLLGQFFIFLPCFLPQSVFSTLYSFQKV